MSILETLSYIAPLATACAVIVAAWQLHLTQRLAQTTFEDSMAREYRKLANEMPTEAFFGEDLTEEQLAKWRNDFYHYFDLCNEQIFFRQIGRVCEQTWEFWRDGIRSNLKRPAFAKSWDDISKRAKGDFAELRSLIASDFKEDPKK